ncbi:hypothetical protein JCM17042A_06920 [Ruminococcus champanellensis 18P13 = JCM 17042]
MSAAYTLLNASMVGVANVPVSMAALMATARILLCRLWFMINAPFHLSGFPVDPYIAELIRASGIIIIAHKYE